MDYSDNELQKDVERVRQISIIPNLLDIVCQTTGMRFAAVARVTDNRWITCSVRDDIAFGLVPGSELRIETTICNDIRDSYQPVVIDNVKESDLFCNHPTPRMYGFQSYVSFPIILKTGEFFGTLCAIDPEPRSVDNATVRGMFAAFADLISFHLQQNEHLEETDSALKSLHQLLAHSEDENRQYRHISSHTLQEPLRKLRVFSGMLLEAVRTQKQDQAEKLALKIQQGATRFSELITDLADLSHLDYDKDAIRLVDPGYVANLAASKLQKELQTREGEILVGEMPKVKAIPDQLEHLFSQLFDNAIKFAKPDVPLLVQVTAREHRVENSTVQSLRGGAYVEIAIADNGIGIEPSQQEAIFDVFSRLPDQIFREGSGIGLSICRKIVRNHSGQITIQSEPGQGTTVTILLPAA